MSNLRQVQETCRLTQESIQLRWMVVHFENVDREMDAAVGRATERSIIGDSLVGADDMNARVLMLVVFVWGLAVPVTVVAQDVEPAATPENQALLVLVKKAYANDPGFRKELEALVGVQPTSPNGNAKKKIADLEAMNTALEKELNRLNKTVVDQGKSLEVWKTWLERMHQRPGDFVVDLIVVNRTPYRYPFRINGRYAGQLMPGTQKYSLHAGQFTTELVGYEPVRTWRITPPNTKLQLEVTQSYSTYRPTYTTRSVAP